MALNAGRAIVYCRSSDDNEYLVCHLLPHLIRAAAYHHGVNAALHFYQSALQFAVCTSVRFLLPGCESS